MGPDITLRKKGYCFNYRVAGILLHQGRILLQGDRKRGYFVPPGGRCSFGESASSAARREIREELGIRANLGRLLWVVENLFPLDSYKFHEIGFYFEVKFDKSDLNKLPEGSFPGPEMRPNQFFRWIPLRKIGQFHVYPPFLAKKIRRLPRSTEYLFIDQLPKINILNSVIPLLRSRNKR